MRMATRISQSHAAEMMEIEESTLRSFLFQWSDELSFKIDGNDIVIENTSQFQQDLDNIFNNWDQNIDLRTGKLDSPRFLPMEEDSSETEIDFSKNPNPITRRENPVNKPSPELQICMCLCIPLTFVFAIGLFALGFL